MENESKNGVETVIPRKSKRFDTAAEKRQILNGEIK